MSSTTAPASWLSQTRAGVIARKLTAGASMDFNASASLAATERANRSPSCCAAMSGVQAELLGRRVDDCPDLVDGVDGEAAASPVLADELLVRGQVEAGDGVVGDIAVDPLDVRPEVSQDLVGRSGDRGERRGVHLARARDGALDEVLVHGWVLPPRTCDRCSPSTLG